jgi:hypothetical protein
MCSYRGLYAQQGRISLKSLTLNELLDSLSYQTLPKKYNLRFTLHPNHTVSLHSAEGEHIASSVYGVSIEYNGEIIPFLNLKHYGNELIIEITKDNILQFGSTYVCVRENWSNSRTIWERSSKYKAHIEKTLNGRYVLKNRNGSKTRLEGDFVEIYRDIEHSRPDVIHYHLTNTKNKKGLANYRGKLILPVEYELVSHDILFHEYRIIAKGDTAGIINLYGKVLEWGRFQTIEKLKSSGDIYIEKFLVKKDDKYGLMNNDLKVGIAPRFDNIQFDYNMAYTNSEVFDDAMQPVLKVSKNGFSGLFNLKNEEIIPAKYNTISLFARGLYLVEKDQEKALYTIEGKQAPLNSFIKIDWFPSAKNNHLPNSYVIKTLEGSIYWQDADDILNRELSYDDFQHRPKTGLYSRFEYLLVQKDGKWGAVNEEGDEIISTEYDSMSYFNFGYNLGQQFVKFYANGSVGLLTLKNDTFLTPVYNNLQLRTDGLDGQIIFIKNGKKGLADREGKLIIPMQYDEIKPDNAGHCIVVRKCEKIGVYHKNGQLLAPAEYGSYRKVRAQNNTHWEIQLYNNSYQGLEKTVSCE